MSIATVAETHISVVFFVGDRAYKLKKPVRTGFLDFSTPELRRAACKREVQLNRRFAPDVYLGTLSVVDGRGQLCDTLVAMKRMPAERRLATLVRAGVDLHDEIRHIARAVAAFHAEAGSSEEIARAGSRLAVLANWEANFEQMKEFVGGVLDPGVAQRVETLARAYLAGREALFEQRIARGLIRDGHGDLLSEDIFCLDDGPRILDCLEFDSRLRYGDVLLDIAFLAMDLERLGAPSLGEEFVRLYLEFFGETHPESLIHHYIGYRAHVRSKVACIRHAQGDPNAAGEAELLLRMCAAHLERARVRVVLVGGLPGSGKSTLASQLSNALGWAVLRSDEIRKDMAGIPHEAPAPPNLYRARRLQAVYTELLRRARIALGQGLSVILDATWNRAASREAARRLASDSSSELLELRCTAPTALLGQRLTGRSAGSSYASDANLDVLKGMTFEDWPEAKAVETSTEVSRSCESALARIAAARGSMVGPNSPA